MNQALWLFGIQFYIVNLMKQAHGDMPQFAVIVNGRVKYELGYISHENAMYGFVTDDGKMKTYEIKA
jgi:hypothetical protein